MREWTSGWTGADGSGRCGAGVGFGVNELTVVNVAGAWVGFGGVGFGGVGFGGVGFGGVDVEGQVGGGVYCGGSRGGE
jgi:hypothetical protein